jgi:phosphoglycolate phosphatase
MKPSLIIFDLDGTLVDSAPDLNACGNRMLKIIGCHPINLEKSKTFIGDGVRIFIEKTLHSADYSASSIEIDEIEKLFLNDYQERSADLSKPYPGVVQTLEKLKKAGYRLGVCTNKPQQASESLLAQLNIDHFFEKIAGGDYYPLRKPNKQHILNLINEMEGAPEKTIMIGDNEHDAVMAKDAQVYFVFCTYGYSRLPVEEIIYQERIHSFLDIINLKVLNL